MEMKDGADIVLGLIENLLVVGTAQECENHTVRAERRLDDVRDVLLLCLVVEVCQVLTGNLLVAGQVIVCSVRNAPELAPAERECKLDIGRCLRVEGQLLLLMIAEAELLLLDAEVEKPFSHEALPVVEPLEVCARLAEELKLHLLELAGAERKVSGSDLISEGLADLADAERNLLSGCTLDILEVHEDALRCLRTEIDNVLRVLCDALEGLEHQVELTDLREVVLAARRAGNIVLFDEVFHLLVGPAVDAAAEVDAVLSREILDQLVRAEALMALLAVHQRVREASEMAGGNPCLRIHENRAVDADVVRALLDEFLPPRLLDVVLQLNTEIAIVPRIRKAAVDLGTRIYKSSGFCERYDLVHRLFHDFNSPLGIYYTLLGIIILRSASGKGRIEFSWL